MYLFMYIFIHLLCTKKISSDYSLVAFTNTVAFVRFDRFSLFWTNNNLIGSMDMLNGKYILSSSTKHLVCSVSKIKSITIPTVPGLIDIL